MGWQIYMAIILLIVWGGTLWLVRKTTTTEAGKK